MSVSYIEKYSMLNEHIFYMAQPFLNEEHSTLVELDAGDGNNAAPFVNACDETTAIALVNASGYARGRFKDDERVRYTSVDLTSSYPLYSANVTLSHFALDAYRPSNRIDILRCIYNKTQPGGALILASRVTSYSSCLTTPIDEAELSLQGGTPPNIPVLPAYWTENALQHAGFEAVECFYRSFSVAAWIAVRA